jgi:hypothetical protein
MITFAGHSSHTEILRPSRRRERGGWCCRLSSPAGPQIIDGHNHLDEDHTGRDQAECYTAGHPVVVLTLTSSATVSLIDLKVLTPSQCRPTPVQHRSNTG